MSHSVCKQKKSKGSKEFSSDPRKTERIDGKVYAMASPAIWHTRITRSIFLAIANVLHKEGPCEVSMENVDLAIHLNSDNKDKRDDYVTPDIMIFCNKDKISGGCFYGVPKFIAEVLSKSTAKCDKTLKLKIYEGLKIPEYWAVNPRGVIDVYYLKNKKYVLHDTLILCRNKDDADEYSEKDEITLRCFPKVKMVLGDIFE